MQTIKWPGDERKEKFKTVKAKYMTLKKILMEKKFFLNKVQFQRTLKTQKGKKK